jgi:hypothetical protein
MNNIEICKQIIENSYSKGINPGCGYTNCDECPLNNDDMYDCDKYDRVVKAAEKYLEDHEQFNKAEAVKRMASGDKVCHPALGYTYIKLSQLTGNIVADNTNPIDLIGLPYYGWKIYRTKKVKKYFWTAKTVEDYFVTVGPYSSKEEAISKTYYIIPDYLSKELEWISKLEESEIIEEIA